MRDAESIFDQVVAFSGNALTYDAVRQVLHVVDQETFFQLTDLIITKNTSGGFALAEDVVMSGYDIQDFLTGLEEHYRNLLVARATGDTRLIEAPEDIRERYTRVAEQFSEGDLLRLLRITAQTMQAVRFSPQPRLKFEVAIDRHDQDGLHRGDQQLAVCHGPRRRHQARGGCHGVVAARPSGNGRSGWRFRSGHRGCESSFGCAGSGTHRGVV
jgi:DNA polymerase III gamma/tau subunit